MQHCGTGRRYQGVLLNSMESWAGWHSAFTVACFESVDNVQLMVTGKCDFLLQTSDIILQTGKSHCRFSTWREHKRRQISVLSLVCLSKGFGVVQKHRVLGTDQQCWFLNNMASACLFQPGYGMDLVYLFNIKLFLHEVLIIACFIFIMWVHYELHSHSMVLDCITQCTATIPF